MSWSLSVPATKVPDFGEAADKAVTDNEQMIRGTAPGAEDVVFEQAMSAASAATSLAESSFDVGATVAASLSGHLRTSEQSSGGSTISVYVSEVRP